MPHSPADTPCVSYRNRKDAKRWRLDTWPFALALGAPLPAVLLWLAGAVAVPLDLEKTYLETCQVLRID